MQAKTMSVTGRTIDHSGKDIVRQKMIEQRYVVLLGERDGKQIWLAYDCGGRIGNADHSQAWKFDTLYAAMWALKREQLTGSRWVDARILGTTVDSISPGW